MVLRMKKEVAAYFYQLMESYEGLCNYSTLDTHKGAETREILLHIAPDQKQALDKVLANIQKEIDFEIVS